MVGRNLGNSVSVIIGGDFWGEACGVVNLTDNGLIGFEVGCGWYSECSLDDLLDSAVSRKSITGRTIRLHTISQSPFEAHALYLWIAPECSPF